MRASAPVAHSQDLRDAPSGPTSRAPCLESRWRSRLLLSHVLALSPAAAAAILPGARDLRRRRARGADAGWNEAGDSRCASLRPCATRLRRRRSPRRRAQADQPVLRLLATRRLASSRLFERSGVDTNTLLGSFTGVVAAMRALERNEWLVMMPDAFDDITHTIAVPFFGRMLRVAAGTAFFALRADALVVPVFTTPGHAARRASRTRPADRFTSILCVRRASIDLHAHPRTVRQLRTRAAANTRTLAQLGSLSSRLAAPSRRPGAWRTTPRCACCETSARSNLSCFATCRSSNCS